MEIDVTFNFQSETEPKDADRYSSKLQEYHRILWSKPLPNGKIFYLEKINGNRLYHKSDLGEFYLSSDRSVPTYYNWKKLAPIISKVPKDKLDHFINITETIGAITIWPCNRISNAATINGIKGLNNKISDRLDLTLECIRRYYLNQESPIFETLKRYDSFFKLFGDFKGFMDFFLFQDLVTDNYSLVKIAIPFDNFNSASFPKTTEEYIDYMNHTEKLVKARNSRIEESLR